jgi:hypothetical protein
MVAVFQGCWCGRRAPGLIRGSLGGCRGGKGTLFRDGEGESTKSCAFGQDRRGGVETHSSESSDESFFCS